MSKRATIVIEEGLFKKLHKIQGEALTKWDGNVSFSDVVNIGLEYAIQKGYNVSAALKGKEEARR